MDADYVNDIFNADYEGVPLKSIFTYVIGKDFAMYPAITFDMSKFNANSTDSVEEFHIALVRVDQHHKIVSLDHTKMQLIADDKGLNRNIVVTFPERGEMGAEDEQLRVYHFYLLYRTGSVAWSLADYNALDKDIPILLELVAAKQMKNNGLPGEHKKLVRKVKEKTIVEQKQTNSDYQNHNSAAKALM